MSCRSSRSRSGRGCFAELTLIGTAIAKIVRACFVRTTAALPVVLLSAGAATNMTLILTHIVAAAFVIPACAGRVSD
jgi:hypothetical protein